MRFVLKMMIAMIVMALPVQAQVQENSVVNSAMNSVVNPAMDPVVVELFTSQGCPSCPRADAFLQELAARDDVLALALHVDYWDYIGWKDSFASPQYTARQRAYAKSQGQRMVYTPQMIINGVDQVVGTRTVDVVDVIARHKTREPYVSLEVTRDGSQLSIRAEAGEPLADRLTVQLIRYRPQARVDIKRGENAGRSINYVNIVTRLEILQQWDTNEPLELEASVSGNEPVVILLQHEGYGPVAAVARLR
ncbi:hypothetical protein that often co-occurs with aconitase [hydrothermal vent metagenome]|uniref:Uncharacterized protein n=1 Tax=hydrothermal vent metagenome TaxID=652676 RepID=A0A3B0SFX5_9ZZZZ